MRATSGSGDSVYTAVASATTPLAAPTTPSNGSAVAVSTSQINVTWRDTAYNETGYNVYRKTGTAGTFVLITTLPPNSSSYTDTGLMPATEYDYHVQAFNAAGYSDFAGSSATTPALGGTVYVSDLGYTPVANGWGPVEKDTSNGESAAGDGHPITLNGVAYLKGLGVHANGEVDVALNGAYTRFQSDVGVDDEVGDAGSVTFQVWADGVKLYDSGLMTGTAATKNIDVDVTGKQTLRLIVTDGGDGFGFDHADWAGARLVPTGAAPRQRLPQRPAVHHRVQRLGPGGKGHQQRRKRRRRRAHDLHPRADVRQGHRRPRQLRSDLQPRREILGLLVGGRRRRRSLRRGLGRLPGLRRRR